MKRQSFSWYESAFCNITEAVYKSKLSVNILFWLCIILSKLGVTMAYWLGCWIEDRKVVCSNPVQTKQDYQIVRIPKS